MSSPEPPPHTPPPESPTTWSQTLTSFPESFRPPSYPHPARYQDVERRRIHRRNTLYAVMWTVIFAGPYFTTVQGGAIPLLAKIADLNDRWYGLIQAMPALALLAQIPGALLVSRLKHRPPVLLFTGVAARVLWVPIAAIPLVFHPGPTASLLLLTLIAVSWISAQMSGLAWQSLVTDLVPRRRRGKYFGLRARLFAAANLITSLILAITLPAADQAHAAWILFAIISISGLIGAVESLTYRQAYDPPQTRPRLRARDLLAPITDRAFFPFLIFGFLIAASSGIVSPFLWRHLLDAQSMPPFRVTLILQTSALIGTFVMGTIWGLWIDKHGTKAATICALLGGQLTTICWPLVTSDRWLLGLGVGFFGMVLWTGVDVAQGNRLYAHGAKGGPSYFAIYNSALALAGFGSTVLGGEIADRLHDATWVAGIAHYTGKLGVSFNSYMVLVILCVLLRFAALFVLMKWLPRDRPTPTADGVRAIALQMQSHVVGLFIIPWRSFRRLPVIREVVGDDASP